MKEILKQLGINDISEAHRKSITFRFEENGRTTSQTFFITNVSATWSPEEISELVFSIHHVQVESDGGDYRGTHLQWLKKGERETNSEKDGWHLKIDQYTEDGPHHEAYRSFTTWKVRLH